MRIGLQKSGFAPGVELPSSDSVEGKKLEDYINLAAQQYMSSVIIELGLIANYRRCAKLEQPSSETNTTKESIRTSTAGIHTENSNPANSNNHGSRSLINGTSSTDSELLKRTIVRIMNKNSVDGKGKDRTDHSNPKNPPNSGKDNAEDDNSDFLVGEYVMTSPMPFTEGVQKPGIDFGTHFKEMEKQAKSEIRSLERRFNRITTKKKPKQSKDAKKVKGAAEKKGENGKKKELVQQQAAVTAKMVEGGSSSVTTSKTESSTTADAKKDQTKTKTSGKKKDNGKSKDASGKKSSNSGTSSGSTVLGNDRRGTRILASAIGNPDTFKYYDGLTICEKAALLGTQRQIEEDKARRSLQRTRENSLRKLNNIRKAKEKILGSKYAEAYKQVLQKAAIDSAKAKAKESLHIEGDDVETYIRMDKKSVFSQRVLSSSLVFSIANQLQRYRND
eukprot:g2354.t1